MSDPNVHIEPETLSAYALDALPPDEIVLVGRHLAACQHCQDEVASLRAAADFLPHGLALAEPPADLRDRVLARARASRRGQPASPMPARPSVPVRTGLPWFRRLLPLAFAVMLVLGFAAGRFWPATTTPDLTGRPDARSAALSGQGQGTFVVDPGARQAQLVVTGLPALPEGQVYQLWLLEGDVPISAGTFTVDANGQGRLEFNGLAWSPDYRTIAITAEQVGGSPGPTSDIVVMGGL